MVAFLWPSGREPLRRKTGRSVRPVPHHAPVRATCRRSCLQRVACDGQLVIHKGGIVGASSGALVAATYFSEAKIKDLGLASLGDHDVRGFYVAVDDASSVGRVQGIGDFN